MFDRIGIALGEAADKAAAFAKHLDPATLSRYLGVLEKIMPVVVSIGTFFATKFASQIPILGQLIGGLNPVVVAIGALAASTPEGRAALSSLMEAAKSLAAALAPIAVVIAESIAPMLKILAGIIKPIAEFMNSNAMATKTFVTALIGLYAISRVVTLVNSLKTALIGLKAVATDGALAKFFLGARPGPAMMGGVSGSGAGFVVGGSTSSTTQLAAQTAAQDAATVSSDKMARNLGKVQRGLRDVAVAAGAAALVWTYFKNEEDKAIRAGAEAGDKAVANLQRAKEGNENTFGGAQTSEDKASLTRQYDDLYKKLVKDKKALDSHSGMNMVKLAAVRGPFAAGDIYKDVNAQKNAALDIQKEIEQLNKLRDAYKSITADEGKMGDLIGKLSLDNVAGIGTIMAGPGSLEEKTARARDAIIALAHSAGVDLTGSVDSSAISLGKASKEADKTTAELEKMSLGLAGIKSKFEADTKAAKDFWDGIGALTDAQVGLAKSQYDVQASFDAFAAKTGDGLAKVKDLFAFADQTRTQVFGMAQSFMAAGDTSDVAKEKLKGIVDLFQQTARGAGFSADEIAKMGSQLGITGPLLDKYLALQNKQFELNKDPTGTNIQEMEKGLNALKGAAAPAGLGRAMRQEWQASHDADVAVLQKQYDDAKAHYEALKSDINSLTQDLAKSHADAAAVALKKGIDESFAASKKKWNEEHTGITKQIDLAKILSATLGSPADQARSEQNLYNLQIQRMDEEIKFATATKNQAKEGTSQRVDAEQKLFDLQQSRNAAEAERTGQIAKNRYEWEHENTALVQQIKNAKNLMAMTADPKAAWNEKEHVYNLENARLAEQMADVRAIIDAATPYTDAWTNASKQLMQLEAQRASAVAEHAAERIRLDKATADNYKSVFLNAIGSVAEKEKSLLTDIYKNQYDRGPAMSVTRLLRNSTKQTAQLAEYESGINALKGRGLSDIAIQALGLDQGPGSNRQIKKLLAADPASLKTLDDSIAKRAQTAQQTAYELQAKIIGREVAKVFRDFLRDNPGSTGNEGAAINIIGQLGNVDLTNPDALALALSKKIASGVHP
jgi:hypothetical protein